MPKIMIMSLGGSPEPLIKSIKANRPEKIIFLASQDSVLLAGDIFKPLNFKPKTEFEMTEDPNLMFECYKAARRCVDRVRKNNIPPEEVVVDYTGGTKVMTAALVLATVGEPYKFNYVGGDRRNKDGVGTVMVGHEKMFAEMSPWSIFAEEERRQVVTLFNRRRFSAVVGIIGLCDRELPPQIGGYFRFVKLLAEGFLFWEQFDHKAAMRRLESGIAALRDYLRTYPDLDLEAFSSGVEECREFLDHVVTYTNGSKNLHLILLEDLLNNARRRINDKRYDDAAARIYRALELYGQITFLEVAGCSNGRVKPEVIPDVLREEFIRKYRDPKSRRLKLPLTATFQYLKARGHEAGLRFFEEQKKIKDVQSNRNSSILAHGIKPITEHAITSIFDTVSAFVRVDKFFDFPTLP
ncbi:MAG: CRISPR-associated protein [Desulfobacteraceae bacterium 4484_190.1]|nr:MAG: CRISPR-associated protein [Desulfobacteraceae bacterium 4484_190.1]